MDAWRTQRWRLFNQETGGDESDKSMRRLEDFEAWEQRHIRAYRKRHDYAGKIEGQRADDLNFDIRQAVESFRSDRPYRDVAAKFGLLILDEDTGNPRLRKVRDSRTGTTMLLADPEIRAALDFRRGVAGGSDPFYEWRELGAPQAKWRGTTYDVVAKYPGKDGFLRYKLVSGRDSIELRPKQMKWVGSSGDFQTARMRKAGLDLSSAPAVPQEGRAVKLEPLAKESGLAVTWNGSGYLARDPQTKQERRITVDQLSETVAARLTGEGYDHVNQWRYDEPEPEPEPVTMAKPSPAPFGGRAPSVTHRGKEAAIVEWINAGNKRRARLIYEDRTEQYVDEDKVKPIDGVPGTVESPEPSPSSSRPRAHRRFVDAATGRRVDAAPSGPDGSVPTETWETIESGEIVEVDQDELVGRVEGDHPRQQSVGYALEFPDTAVSRARAEKRARAAARRAKPPRKPKGPPGTFGTPLKAAKTFYDANEMFFDHIADPWDGLRDWMDGIETTVGRSKKPRKLATTPTGKRILEQRQAQGAITRALAYIFGQATATKRWDDVPWFEVDRLEASLLPYYERPEGEASQGGIYWRPVVGELTRTDIENLPPEQQERWSTWEASQEIGKALEELKKAYKDGRDCMPAHVREVVERRIDEWEIWRRDPSKIPPYACEPDQETGGYTCDYPSVHGELRRLKSACSSGYDPAWPVSPAREGRPGFPDASTSPADPPLAVPAVPLEPVKPIDRPVSSTPAKAKAPARAAKKTTAAKKKATKKSSTTRKAAKKAPKKKAATRKAPKKKAARDEARRAKACRVCFGVVV